MNWFKIQIAKLQYSDHSPDNVKFLDIARTVHGTRHVKYYSYHAYTSVTVSGVHRNTTVHDPKPYLMQNRLLLNTCMDANIQLTVLGNFSQTFTKNSNADISWQLSNSLTFPDKSPPWKLPKTDTGFCG